MATSSGPINLAAFYLAGIPVPAILGFYTSLRGVGLWIRIIVGASIQLALLGVVAICTNYGKSWGWLVPWKLYVDSDSQDPDDPTDVTDLNLLHEDGS